jgi:DNA (cytosine-5)-methyltransferase 1
MAEKPPYRVPLMSEIAKFPKNGVKVVSTFSGAGGSCLGFEMAGCDVIWSSEFVERAREVHELNFPGCPVDSNDIRVVEPEEILDDVGMDVGEVDILNGSPPCASFSQAGSREKLWGKVKQYSDVKQRADDLFFEFARLVAGIEPRVFVAENVSGLRLGKAKGYLKMIHKALVDAGPGYKVKVKELDAQWLGVPQSRKRLIFIGVRNDLPFEPAYPKPFPYYYTLADACPWLAHRGQHHYYSDVDKDDFYWTDLDPNEEVDISKYAIAQEWHNVAPGKGSDKYLNLIKAHPDKPSPTVTSTGGNPSAAGVVCPDKPRKFTIPELKRICGFPDDFKLTGSYAQRWERLGRAVPPPMMRAVAEALVPSILEHCR